MEDVGRHCCPPESTFSIAVRLAGQYLRASNEGKGFVPAGQLVIGNAIVTRAGPDAEVVGIEWKEQPNRVYNFTVEGDHTYFVGTTNGGL
jgi:hypothetical protein